MVGEDAEYALEVGPVDDQQPVEALGAGGADEAFGVWGAKNSVLPAKSLICRARIEFGTPQASRLREAQADLTPARVMSTLPVEAGSEAVTTRLPIEASRFHGAPSRIHSGCFSPNRAVSPW